MTLRAKIPTHRRNQRYYLTENLIFSSDLLSKNFPAAFKSLSVFQLIKVVDFNSCYKNLTFLKNYYYLFLMISRKIKLGRKYQQTKQSIIKRKWRWSLKDIYYKHKTLTLLTKWWCLKEYPAEKLSQKLRKIISSVINFNVICGVM